MGHDKRRIEIMAELLAARILVTNDLLDWETRHTANFVEIGVSAPCRNVDHLIGVQSLLHNTQYWTNHWLRRFTRKARVWWPHRREMYGEAREEWGRK